MTGQIVWSCSVLLPPITTLNPHLLVPQSLCSLLSSHELCMTQDDQSHFAKLGNNFWLFHWRIIAKTVNLYLIRTSKSVLYWPMCDYSITEKYEVVCSSENKFVLSKYPIYSFVVKDGFDQIVLFSLSHKIMVWMAKFVTSWNCGRMNIHSRKNA